MPLLRMRCGGLFLVVILFLLPPAAVRAAECNGKGLPGPPNTNPINTDPPKLINSVPNGKLYSVGRGDDAIDLLHVYGTPFEMGEAQGRLLKDKLDTFYPQVYTYLASQVAAKAANNSVFRWILEQGLDVALDLSYDRTKAYIQPYVEQEIKGLAHGAGRKEAEVRRVMWLGELTRGACSMFGAWGNATATRDGKLLQLRALDWDVDGPFRNFHTVTVYHPKQDPAYPDQPPGHAWANVGFAGWTASVTGMSSVPLGMSEIGVSFPDASFGKEHYLAKGYPFGFLIRDVLQFDRSLDEALHRITSARRTCDLLLGVGDGNANAFRGIQYSPSVANVFDDTNLRPLNDSWHPRIPQVVYWGMDWICPNDNAMLAHQLQRFHGNITVANTIEHITSYVTTGDLHIAIYDHSAMKMYIATAKREGAKGPLQAYQRQFTELDMAALFAEQ